MEDIDIVITCMGRLAHLKQSLPLALAQENAHCIVVDYSCPDRSGAWVEEHAPQAQVVRIDGQKYFNLSAARNAGAQAGKAPWIFFLDADKLLDEKLVPSIRPELTEDSFYNFEPQSIDATLTGSCICPRRDFEQIGGYDDMFQGWGREDIDLYIRLKNKGLRRQTLAGDLIAEIEHSDVARTEHQEIKHQETNRLINRLYGRAKLDLEFLHDNSMDRMHRQHLYNRSRQAVAEARHFGRSDLYCPLEKFEIAGVETNRLLHYHLDGEPGRWQPGTSSALPDFASALKDIYKRWPELGGSSSEEPLFLLAAGHRSGSTLLQRMFMKERWMWGEPYGHSGLIENLSMTFRCLTEDWPKDRHLESHLRFNSAQDQAWIANLYPDPQHLVDSTLQYLQTLFAAPARGKGFERWGIKEVILDTNMALFLKWLYPHCRLVFLIRNPYYAYRSYRRFDSAWFTRWPDHPLASPEQFGVHWLNLAQSFLAQAEELGAMVLRYEELRLPGFDWTEVEQHIGHTVDREAMEYQVAGHNPDAKHTDPATLDQELLQLSNVVNTFASSIGYWLPTPDDLIE